MIKLVAIFPILLFTITSNAQTLPKLSGYTQQFMHESKKNAELLTRPNADYVYRYNAQGELCISALIKVQAGFNENTLLEKGVQIGTKAGTVWTVQVPVKSFNVLIQTPGISYIDLDQPVGMLMDSARVATRTDSVHAGIDLPQPYTGKNVVVGIIDAGFDYTHPMFYDTAYQALRIKKVWEQKYNGTPPVGFSYGAEFSDSLNIITKATDIVDGSHGAHVAGIAAGSGVGGDSTGTACRGIAYNSDLVFTAIYPAQNMWLSTGMGDILDGMSYTYNYAASVQKPAVVNLSWGNPLGPRDGSSLFAEACDNLTGPGKIFVLSAGNNGNKAVHLRKQFSNTDTAVHTILTFPQFLDEKRNWLDIWGDTAQNFCVQFSLYSGFTKRDSSTIICLDNSTKEIALRGSNGDTCFITVTALTADFNEKPHVLAQLYSHNNDRVCVSVFANTGKVDMWQGLVKNTSGYYGTFTKLAYPFATAGDSAYQISDMASTRSAITVAAYTSKTNFKTWNGGNYNYGGTVGNIAAFSSRGPSSDGRLKPDIAAPGMSLNSSVNSYDTSFLPNGPDKSVMTSTYTSPLNGRTYPYANFQGTSMSSPVVSGIVALLLEINPYLDPNMIRNILTETAIHDNYTETPTATPNTTWGVGKINAYAAIKKTLATVGITHPEKAEIECLLYPNPSNGLYQLKFYATASTSTNIEVTNTLGQKVKSEKMNAQVGWNETAIDLTALPSGNYLVCVTLGKRKSVIRLVKN